MYENIDIIITMLTCSAGVALYIKRDICKDLTELKNKVGALVDNHTQQLSALKERVEVLESEAMRR